MYNCSPMKYQPKNLKDEDVIIRHFHGDSNVRTNKSEKGWNLWRPIYQECLEKNVGGMAEWRGKIKNKFMSRLEAC